MMSSVAKRSVVIAGHKTSVSLESEFWQALKEIARKKSLSLSELITKIDEMRNASNNGNLSSALRVYVVEYYKKQCSV